MEEVDSGMSDIVIKSVTRPHTQRLLKFCNSNNSVQMSSFTNVRPLYFRKGEVNVLWSFVSLSELCKHNVYKHYILPLKLPSPGPCSRRQILTVV